MDVNGAAPVTLCDAPSPREGSWGEDGNIVFAATNHGGLSRVASTGGTPQLIVELDHTRGDTTYRYPQVLPGAHAVLFMNGGNTAGDGTIEVQSFETGKRKTLVQAGAYARYLPSGHLVYMHAGTLFAVPMDADKLELTGQPAPIIEGVSFQDGTGTAGYTFSESGTFVYVAARPEHQLRPVIVIDEKGTSELPIPKARYSRPRPSPDGARLAVAVKDGPAAHIWMYEFGSQRFSRFALPEGNSNFPIWTPDGKNLIFSSDMPTPGPGIYWMRSDGSGAPQRLVEGTDLVPSSFSAATGRLIYETQDGPNRGVFMLPLNWRDGASANPGAPERFPERAVSTPAALSPGGKWLAYVFAPLGIPEVFVRPFPMANGLWQVSTGGGMPVWSPNTRELFYQSKPDFRLMVAGYSVAGGSFSAERPRLWSETRVESFDVMPDGKRIVAFPAIQNESTHAIFLLNYMDDLRRRLPPRRNS
jgi:serine/threonine-protein kinase